MREIPKLYILLISALGVGEVFQVPFFFIPAHLIIYNIIYTEVENDVNILNGSDIPMAGEFFTLICEVVSDRIPLVTWIDPNGVPCPLSGPDMTVSAPLRDGSVTTVILTFNSIRTSQSGIYVCISNITVPSSIKQTSYLVRVQSK